MKNKTIISIVILVAFMFLVMRSFSEQVGGYMDFTEATSSGEYAHVVGQWVNSQPTTYNRDSNTFTFFMKDGNGTIHQVRYNNPKPANFEDAEEVVIEGKMEDGVFTAEHILIKCPSKYNDERPFQEST